MDLLLSIAQSRPNYRFMVFGSNDGSHPELAAAEQALGALSNVTLSGAYDDFSDLPFDQCDIFLYTSSSDGMPNVVIEAMAHGLPLVAPDVGGVAELVDQETGWLVQDSADAGAYLAALDQALSDKAHSCLRALSALERVRARHSYEAFAHRLSQIPGYMSWPARVSSRDFDA